VSPSVFSKMAAFPHIDICP